MTEGVGEETERGIWIARGGSGEDAEGVERMKRE